MSDPSDVANYKMKKATPLNHWVTCFLKDTVVIGSAKSYQHFTALQMKALQSFLHQYRYVKIKASSFTQGWNWNLHKITGITDHRFKMSHIWLKNICNNRPKNYCGHKKICMCRGGAQPTPQNIIYTYFNALGTANELYHIIRTPVIHVNSCSY